MRNNFSPKLFLALLLGFTLTPVAHAATEMNPNLKKCINVITPQTSPPTLDCNAVPTVPPDPSNWNDTLTDSNGRKLTGWYDRAGVPCAGQSSTCVYELRAFFRILCPGGAATCDRADTIAPFYIMRQRAEIPGAAHSKDVGTPPGGQPAAVFGAMEIAQAVSDTAANCAAMGGEWNATESYCNFLSASLTGSSKVGIWTALTQECVKKGGEFVACTQTPSAFAMGCGASTECTLDLYTSGGSVGGATYPAGNCMCRTEFFSDHNEPYDRSVTFLANRQTLVSDPIPVTTLFPGETKMRRYRIRADIHVELPALPQYSVGALSPAGTTTVGIDDTQDAICRTMMAREGWAGSFSVHANALYDDPNVPLSTATFNGGAANYGPAGMALRFVTSYGTGGQTGARFVSNTSWTSNAYSAGYSCQFRATMEWDGYLGPTGKMINTFRFSGTNGGADVPGARIRKSNFSVLQDRNIANSWR